MTQIIVDSRELRSEVYSALREQEGLELSVRELSSGDYLLRADFAVERKASIDFIASILDRRLFSQVARLKGEYERVLFVIEGNPYQERSGIAAQSIRGALSYLITVEGVSVISVENAHESAKLMATMARHLQEGLGYEVPLRGGKPKRLGPVSQFLVEGLPGIGPSGAKALLSHFGSAEAVFTASVEELGRVRGLGQKTAERIREALLYREKPLA